MVTKTPPARAASRAGNASNSLASKPPDVQSNQRCETFSERQSEEVSRSISPVSERAADLHSRGQVF